jgi:hypothetical protein
LCDFTNTPTPLLWTTFKAKNPWTAKTWGAILTFVPEAISVFLASCSLNLNGVFLNHGGNANHHSTMAQRTRMSASIRDSRKVKADRSRFVQRPAPVVTSLGVHLPAIVTPSPRDESLERVFEDEQPLKRLRNQNSGCYGGNTWIYFRTHLMIPMIQDMFPTSMFGQQQDLASMYYNKLSEDSKKQLKKLLDEGKDPTFEEFIADESAFAARQKKIALGKMIRFIFEHDCAKDLQKRW